MRRSVILGMMAFGACTSGDAGPSAVATVDTLANGAVHVVTRPEGAWALTGAEPWRLVEELRIGVVEGEEPYMFGQVVDVIPDVMGRIWVLDSQAWELRLFDAQGRFVRSVGGPGEGPGEFSLYVCGLSGPQGEIWVGSRGMWQRFDTAGAFIGGQIARVAVGCGVRTFTERETLVVADSRYNAGTGDFDEYHVEHELDSAGRLVPRDTFPALELAPAPTISWRATTGHRTRTRAVPFTQRPRSMLGPRGFLWAVEGSDYRVRRQTLAGDTLLIMERPFEPVPVPDSARAREIAELDPEGYAMEGSFDLEDVPRAYPPIDLLTVATDGTLWVRREVGPGRYGLDVFAADGRYLGPVDPPPDFDRMGIHRITPTHMYGTVRDELDVQYVVRLGIRKPGG